jgi:predicted acylesterase/phospholipase RssA
VRAEAGLRQQPLAAALPALTAASPTSHRAEAAPTVLLPAVLLPAAAAAPPPAAAAGPAAAAAGFDLVLSSGFLAFASHCGFLQAVEDAGLPVAGVMGTSAGALVGSLYAAGYAPRAIAAELRRAPPIRRVRAHAAPWRGILSLGPTIEVLRGLLPAAFEGLEREFAVGVVAGGRHLCLDSGALAEAVAASAAVPALFRPVRVPGAAANPCVDGGVACRIGLDLWRARRRAQGFPSARVPPAVVHLIGRSSPFSGNDDTAGLAAQGATVLRSAKSGASLWDLDSSFDDQFEAARRRARPALEKLAGRRSARAAPTRDRIVH